MRLVFNKVSYVVLAALFLPGLALAEEAAHQLLDLTASGVGANAGGAFSPFGDITTLMLTGLGYLQLMGFYLKKTRAKDNQQSQNGGVVGDIAAFDVFDKIARANPAEVNLKSSE